MGKKADALRGQMARLMLDLEGGRATISMLQKDMPVGEHLMRVALDHFWNALGAEHQTEACGKLRDLIAERDALKRALDLAVAMLAPHEPGHSCAVSDEFVALAAASAGDTSAPVMEVIDRPRDPTFFNAVPINLEVVVS